MASNQDNWLSINSIGKIVAWCNLAGNQESNQEKQLISQDEKKKLNKLVKRELGEKTVEILAVLIEGEFSRKEILGSVGLSNQTKNKQKYIVPLTGFGFIEFTIPENPNDRNQKYKLTVSGRRFINMLL